jgi:Rrf2 family protein
MISQAGEYALRAAVYLGRSAPDVPVSAGEIAAATKVPQAYLQKILRLLTRDKLLIAQRGVGGGFMLAKMPSAISMLDVLKACNSQPDRIERCPLGITGHTELCSLHKLLDQQIEQFEHTFATISIADLDKQFGGVRPMCEVDPGASKPVNTKITVNRDEGESDR